jgi:hypothetical protein
MTQGWSVIVRRRGAAIEREMWDCAIANPTSAEKAVRRASGAGHPRGVTAYTRLSASDIQSLGLKEGEVRKRSPATEN